MSRNRFRLVLVTPLLFAIFLGLYEYIWPDPISEKAYEYILEIEPEQEGGSLIIGGVIFFIALILTVVSFVGLLLFKSWARHLYALGLIFSFSFYPFMGVSVLSGFSQVLYDCSMVLTGVILALIYYSPIASYYEHDT